MSESGPTGNNNQPPKPPAPPNDRSKWWDPEYSGRLSPEDARASRGAGCVAPILVLCGLVLLAPGGLCVAMGLHDPAAMQIGLLMVFVGGLLIFAAIQTWRGRR